MSCLRSLQFSPGKSPPTLHRCRRSRVARMTDPRSPRRPPALVGEQGSGGHHAGHATTAGAGSFTHVHDVAAAHGQAGWLAWADAVVLELMSIAPGWNYGGARGLTSPHLLG